MAGNPVISQLIDANEKWARDFEALNPGYFAKSAKEMQTPKILWIGCADSRVPESLVVAAKPGDIFVHRNIDIGKSALHLNLCQFDYVHVEHVIIVGHTECGGAITCFNAIKLNAGVQPSEIVPIAHYPTDAPINQFLRPLTALAASLDLPQDAVKGVPLIVEANVKAQVENISKTETMVKAWENGKKVWVHGLVYEVREGRLRDLGISRGPTS